MGIFGNLYSKLLGWMFIVLINGGFCKIMGFKGFLGICIESFYFRLCIYCLVWGDYRNLQIDLVIFLVSYYFVVCVQQIV